MGGGVNCLFISENMDPIKIEPISDDEESASAQYSEGNVIYIKQEYISEETPFSSDIPENNDPEKYLQCKEEEILPEESIKSEDLLGFSDQSAADASLVDDTCKEEATQPLPWRVSGSEEQTISKERTKQSSNIAHMQTYSCKMCNKNFTSRLTLEKHQKSHSVYWCKDCNYEFCSRVNLQLPAGNSGTPFYACELCNANFSNVVRLRGHVAQFHCRQKPYSCDQCTGVAASNSDVQQMPNKCLNVPKERLQCKGEEILPETEVSVKSEDLLGFSDQSAADASLVDDTCKEEATQPLPWRVSGSEQQTISKGRTKQSSNIAHMQTYSCKICNKKFTSLLTLEKHQKSHSVYWCKDCNYEFCSRLNLQLPAVNSGTHFYVCELCNANLTSAGKLRGHVTRFHWQQKPYSCDQCADGSASNSDVQQAPYKCLLCKHSFTSPAYLQQHLKQHSKERAYLCNTCNMQCFSLAMFKSHLATHTEEKSVAPKMYKRKSK